MGESDSVLFGTRGKNHHSIRCDLPNFWILSAVHGVYWFHWLAVYDVFCCCNSWILTSWLDFLNVLLPNVLYTIITPLLHHYYTIITPLLHHYYTIIQCLEVLSEATCRHFGGSNRLNKLNITILLATWLPASKMAKVCLSSNKTK